MRTRELIIGTVCVFLLSSCGESIPNDIRDAIVYTTKYACVIQNLDKQDLSEAEKLAKLAELQPQIDEMKAASVRIKDYANSLDESAKKKIRPEILKLTAESTKKAGC
tara:strand:+ start:99 stop:422 length:324 start_codon:yes stop_codon:yes gene_type:complete